MLNGQNKEGTREGGGRSGVGECKVYKIIAHFARHLSGFYEWTRQSSNSSACLPAPATATVWAVPACCRANGLWPSGSCKLQVALLQVAAMRKVAIKTRTASTERAH